MQTEASMLVEHLKSVEDDNLYKVDVLKEIVDEFKKSVRDFIGWRLILLDYLTNMIVLFY